VAEDSGSDVGSIKISAREILDKIQRGEPVEYDGVVIDGGLNLEELDLPIQHIERTEAQKKLDCLEEVKLVVSRITISDSVIDGSLNFSSIIFKEPLFFFRVQFNGDAYFIGSQFSGEVRFVDCKFNGDAKFAGTQFSGRSFFNLSQFSFVTFFISQFNGDATFVGSRFNGNASFDYSQFSGDANFVRPQFDGDAYFIGSQFSGEARFDGSEFKRDVLFNNVALKKVGGFHLPQCRFNRIYVEFSDIKKGLSFDSEAYLSLIANYKLLGWFEDADECYYFYRSNSDINDPIRRLFDLAARYSYGYGVKPVRPLAWSVFIIMLSGLIFYYVSNGIASFGSALFFSANIFTSGASSLIDSTTISMTGSLAYLVTLERLLGWVFFVLFIASIGKTIIR
jgi:hypothetical protein